MSGEQLFVTCLRTGDESAWLEFIHRFHPLIASVVLRVARQWNQPSPSVVDDLVQETYLKLCADGPRLSQNFRSAHKDAVYGYLKVFAANLAQDYFKNMYAKKRGGEEMTTSLNDEVNKEDRIVRGSDATTLERSLLINQVETFLQSALRGPTGKRDRRIFWMYYRTGLTASEIASLPAVGLSTKGVESTILRLTRTIKEQLREKQVSTIKREQRKGIGSAESL